MAVASFLKRFGQILRKNVDDFVVVTTYFPKFPPTDRYDFDYCLSFVDQQNYTNNSNNKSFDLKDILKDAFLWAVPRNRRTIERRHKRKYGSPDYQLKIILPKTILKVCKECGDDHEVGVLCPTCYKKVMEETKLMQDNIQKELGLSPVENEVVVVYAGEKDEKPTEFWEGKRIVEIEKERPSWFSKNLMQKTTQQPATTKDVKPSDLG